jgi:DNA repair protein RadD
LRGYQRAAIDALYKYWQDTDEGNGLLVVPTGGGKSLVMAALIKEICDKWPGTRILVLSHVKELISQNHDELLEYWPEAPVGIFSAGIGRKEIQAQVLIAGIQSIDKHAHKLEPAPEIVIVDEAHLIPRSESTRYKKTLKTLEQMYPAMKCVGLSATPYRIDSGYLHLGKDAIFDRIVYEVQIQKLIDQGYLAPVVPYGSSVKIDTSAVHHSGREFIAGELEDAAMAGDITARAVADMVERARDRKKWLIFACGKLHAEQIRGELEKHDIRSEVITSETPKEARDRIIEEYKTDATLEPIRALININVLTTGFNAPSIDMIAMLRPTESCGLYVQSVGRGMRVAPGKKNCLVLDYAGNTVRHGPIDAVHPEAQWSGDGPGIAPVKECPECYALVLASVRVCPYCGYEFPKVEVQIEEKPSEAPLLKSQETPPEPEELQVDATEYRLHIKEGKPESVCVTYRCGLVDIREWVFPSASNQYGQFQYRKFCIGIGMEYPYPETARDFLQNILPQAKRILVEKKGKWDRVKAHEWILRENDTNDVVPF